MSVRARDDATLKYRLTTEDDELNRNTLPGSQCGHHFVKMGKSNAKRHVTSICLESTKWFELASIVDSDVLRVVRKRE